MAQLNPAATSRAGRHARPIRQCGLHDVRQLPGQSVPPPPVQLPGNYKFVAWVQMRDFIFKYGNWTCLRRARAEPGRRQRLRARHPRHQRLTEWWDDLTSMGLTPMPGLAAKSATASIASTRLCASIYPLKRQALTGSRRRPASGESMESAGTLCRSGRRRGAAAMPAQSPQPGASCRGPRSRSPSSGIASAARWLRSMWRKIRRPRKSRRPCCARWRRRASAITTLRPNSTVLASVVAHRQRARLMPKPPYFGFWHIETEYEYNSGVVDDSWCRNAGIRSTPICTCSIRASRCLQVLRLVDGEDGARRRSCPQKCGGLLRAPALPSAAEKEIAIAAPAGTTINITIKVG